MPLQWTKGPARETKDWQRCNRKGKERRCMLSSCLGAISACWRELRGLKPICRQLVAWEPLEAGSCSLKWPLSALPSLPTPSRHGQTKQAAAEQDQMPNNRGPFAGWSLSHHGFFSVSNSFLGSKFCPHGCHYLPRVWTQAIEQQTDDGI